MELCMLLALTIVVNTMSMRLSPEEPSNIMSIIRSRIMLSARDLLQSESSSCDSLISGPRCLLFNSDDAPPSAVSGIIEPEVLGLYDEDLPDDIYKLISYHFQMHWPGASSPYRHATRTTNLESLVENQMVFHPVPLDNESFNFRRGTGSFFELNSFYSSISFKKQFVSFIELQVKAPNDTGVFVRGYEDGKPRWFRYVRPGSSQNVASASKDDDPSIEAVDYVEIIGNGARIESLILSVESDSSSVSSTPPLFYLDAQFHPTTRKARSRVFRPSAHLVDMDTALRRGLKLNPSPALVESARDEQIFTYSHLLASINTTTAALRPDYPAKSIDSLIQSVDMYIKKNPKLAFDDAFTDRLLEAPPDLIAFLIRVPPEPNTLTLIHEDTTSDIAEASESHLEYNVSVRFEPLHNMSENVTPLVDSLIASLTNVLGSFGFQKIITSLKIRRFIRDQKQPNLAEPNISDHDSIDEEILKDVILTVLDLPSLNQVPRETRKEVMSGAITVLLPEGTTTAVDIDDLVALLVP